MDLEVETYEEALDILKRYAFVRNRELEREPRYIRITDDHAAALLYVLEGERLHGS